MIGAKDVKVLDINSEFFGVPTETLMENAGKGTAEFVFKKYKPKSVTIFCGMGNNGGDGFVAARYLSNYCKCTVVIVKDPSHIKTELARKNFEKLKDVDIVVYDQENIDDIIKLIEKSDVIIDAMLGVGLSGELREPYKSCVELLNKRNKATLVSVDVPTGLGTNLSIVADATVTFHDIKEGMNKETCGEIKIVDIGIPKDAETYVGPGELKVYYPKPSPTSHKGKNGVLLVIGGGPYIGAPVFAALGALRTGVDLVYLATPKRVTRAFYSLFYEEEKKTWRRESLLNLITFELSDENILVEEDISLLQDLINKSDAIVLGCGMGKDERSYAFVRKLLDVCKGKSIVIDADAIGMVGRDRGIIKNVQAVFTPHAGEFFQLTGEKLPEDIEKREKIIKEWAKKLNSTIVLKGAEDIISDGKKLKRNKVHHHSMTVGGTGDVLSGIIGALLSKGISPFLAGCIGTFINGSAGLRAFEKYSYGALATDLIEEIPYVLKKYL